ncbi:MAG: hypothetical protein A4E52_02219 [Pelotomaculum sp. PtaB.Bin013]|nr:MAG: hypothetical protein A4E52_02219 [Pelotomaculum sp. PtaB.Bin013]
MEKIPHRQVLHMEAAHQHGNVVGLKLLRIEQDIQKPVFSPLRLRKARVDQVRLAGGNYLQLVLRSKLIVFG